MGDVVNMQAKGNPEQPKQEPQVTVENEIVNFALTVGQLNGLLNVLNQPFQAPAVVLVGYINRLAEQADPQIKAHVERLMGDLKPNEPA